MSPNRRVSCAAASPRTRTILDSLSPGRWAARSVTSSLSRSAEGTIAPPTAQATSVRGGGRPVSIRSKSPAGSGRRRTDAASGDLNDRHYPGRMALPRPPTQPQRAGTSAPPQRRKRKPACRIFPTSKGSAAGYSRIVTMWRPNEPVEEDVSAPLGIAPQGKRRRSRRRAWRDGLADQTVVQTLEHVRSYRAFERGLIASVDPRSALELALAHRLASLLWRLCRACAIETGLFEMQGELRSARRQDPSRGSSQPGALQTANGANGHSKGPGSNGHEDPPVNGHEPLATTIRAA